MKYTLWLKAAAAMQFLTAALHSISLFTSPTPGNATEKQIFDLMQTYQFDFGNGFHRSMNQLVLSLSSCLSLLCLLGGLLNWFLISKKLDAHVMKGVININIIIFGICFALMAALTFLPPIACTGLIFLFLLISRVTISKKSMPS